MSNDNFIIKHGKFLDDLESSDKSYPAIVILGYGKVGKSVVSALKRKGFGNPTKPIIVVDKCNVLLANVDTLPEGTIFVPRDLDNDPIDEEFLNYFGVKTIGLCLPEHMVDATMDGLKELGILGFVFTGEIQYH